MAQLLYRETMVKEQVEPKTTQWIRSVAVDEVRQLLEQGAQLVEVLPDKEYAEEHLPGAIHIALNRLTPQAVSVLDRTRPVIVYCWDLQCDLSPRAAWRLQSMGFDVYDYAGGKLNWLATGLPTEGEKANEPRIGRLARNDVPICSPDEPVQEAQRRLNGSAICLVVNQAGVVLGRLGAKEFAAAGEGARAEDAMYPGPSTFRPYVPVEEMREYMDKRNMKSAPVTDADGHFIGMLHREDLPQA